MLDSDISINEDSADAVIYVKNDGTTTKSASLTINGGIYIGGTTAVNVVQGTATINGGTFKALLPFDGIKWVLNCNDYYDGQIIVAGGMFYKLNPAESACGEDEIVIADGYTVVRCNEDGTANDAGDWYKVVKA